MHPGRVGVHLLLTAALLVAPALQGAEIWLSNSPAGGTYQLNFNPRASDGLVPVASSANDVSIFRAEDNVCYWLGIPGDASSDSQYSVASAGYGSDSSLDGVAHPDLVGYSVEPMADASSHATIHRYSSCSLEQPRQPPRDS
jgi:hypothetical protein